MIVEEVSMIGSLICALAISAVGAPGTLPSSQDALADEAPSAAQTAPAEEPAPEAEAGAASARAAVASEGEDGEEKRVKGNPTLVVEHDREGPGGDWSLGIGLGWLPVLVLGSTPGQLAGLSAPSGTFSVERRLSKQLFLMGLAGAYLSRGETEHTQSTTGAIVTNESSHISANIAVGPRWLLNPSGTVEVSGYALISAEGQYATSSFIQFSVVDPQRLNSRSYSIGAQAGVVLEHEVLDGFWLRLDTTLLRVGYSADESNLHPEGLSVAEGGIEYLSWSGANSFSAHATVEPRLGLRVAL